MQVGVDVKCMQTEFGGRGFFGFGDIAREGGRGERNVKVERKTLC